MLDLFIKYFYYKEGPRVNNLLSRINWFKDKYNLTIVDDYYK